MRSNPLRRQAQRFGRRHSQPPIEFPCYAPQRDGKSPKMTGHPSGGCRLQSSTDPLRYRIHHPGAGRPENRITRCPLFRRKVNYATIQFHHLCDGIWGRHGSVSVEVIPPQSYASSQDCAHNNSILVIAEGGVVVLFREECVAPGGHPGRCWPASDRAHPEP